MDLGAGEPQDGPSLQRAARRLGVDPSLLAHNREKNIEAAASELRWQADLLQDESGLEIDRVDDWAEVVGWYSGSDDGGAQRSFTKQVYRWIEGGLRARTDDGEVLLIEPRDIDIPMLDAMPASSTGDSSLAANWVGAASCNYSNTSRGASNIDTIVVHTAQGSYSGTYNWFQNCSAAASTHYVIRSSDGEITQMMWEQDTAWHAGHSDTNRRSVAIELEGYIEYPETWFTDAMIGSLADLIVDISDRQGVPIDRDHIIGHNEVPGCADGSGGGQNCHTDPGPGFDWDKLMALVGGGSGSAGDRSQTAPDSGDSGTSGSQGTGDIVGFMREGSVYDSSAGVGGATVSLSSRESTTSDGNGFYTISGAPAGWTEITVNASGYGIAVRTTEIDEGIVNWGSVALTASSGGGSEPTSTYDPTDWETVLGPEVTMRWSSTGAASYEVKIYWHDGSDWNYYYAYTSSSTEKTFWPVVDDSWSAWTVRASGGEWSALNYFYFDH